MHGFQGQKNVSFKRKLYSWPVLLILLVCVILLGFSVRGLYAKSRIAEANRREAEAHLESLKERKTQLGAELERLATDEGVETEIRTRFPVAKPDEGVIQIVEEEKTDSATSSPLVKPSKESFWKRFF